MTGLPSSPSPAFTLPKLPPLFGLLGLKVPWERYALTSHGLTPRKFPDNSYVLLAGTQYLVTGAAWDSQGQFWNYTIMDPVTGNSYQANENSLTSVMGTGSPTSHPGNAPGQKYLPGATVKWTDPSDQTLHTGQVISATWSDASRSYFYTVSDPTTSRNPVVWESDLSPANVNSYPTGNPVSTPGAGTGSGAGGAGSVAQPPSRLYADGTNVYSGGVQYVVISASWDSSGQFWNYTIMDPNTGDQFNLAESALSGG